MTRPGDDQIVLVERHAQVMIITINRPGARNAVNSSVATAIGEALEELDHDESLCAGVITGAGPAFCAGADLKAVASGEPLEALGHADWGFAGLVDHVITKPLIAAVNGPAFGGGAEIVLACDLAVMSDEARLGLPEVTRGLFAAGSGLINLPRHVPTKIAMEMALIGGAIEAHDAQRWGIVNRVVPRNDVVSESIRLAEQIAQNAPLAVAVSKQMVAGAFGTGSALESDLLARQAASFASILDSADAREGAEAFAAKREPVWTGS